MALALELLGQRNVLYSVQQDNTISALVICTVHQGNIHLIEIQDKNVLILPVTHNTLFATNMFSGY